MTNENEADISIGTEIPDLNITDEMQNQVSIHSYEAEHDGIWLIVLPLRKVSKKIIVSFTPLSQDSKFTFY